MVAILIGVVHSATVADELEDLPKPLNQEDECSILTGHAIAARFKQAHLDARFIFIEATVSTSKGEEIAYRYEGTHDSWRTVSFVDGNVYGAVSFHDRRVQEFVPEHPQRLLISYDALDEARTGRRVYPRELDCYWGLGTTFWLGPRSQIIPELFVDRLQAGKVIETTILDDHPCYVVEYVQEWADGNGDTIRNPWLYYVDQESYVIRLQKATFETIRDGAVIATESRVIRHTEVELHADEPEIDWELWSLLQDMIIDEEECAEKSDDNE